MTLAQIEKLVLEVEHEPLERMERGKAFHSTKVGDQILMILILLYLLPRT